jgi:hypothetical protein
MSDRTGIAVRFLTSMAQALATMSLYAEGHPARARAAVASFDILRELQQADPRPSFSFLGSEVVYGQQAIRGLTDWEWALKLANVGVQRLEFGDMVERDAYVGFLEDVLARVSAFTAIAAANAPANVPRGQRANRNPVRCRRRARFERRTGARRRCPRRRAAVASRPERRGGCDPLGARRSQR